MIKSVHGNLGNKTVTIETGKLAKQANGAVMVSFGDTRVLVTAVSDSSPREDLDMVPLTVDYIEKYYAAGKIPGGYIKREAKPSTQATLNSRIIDRPIRPLLPSGYNYETSICATVMSLDPDHSADQVALIGASTALMISDIPFNGPIAGCKVARVDGNFIASPSAEELAKSDLEIFVAASESAVVMVEGAVKLLPEDVVLDAIMFGFDACQPLLKIQKELQKSVGKKKREVKHNELPEKFIKAVKDHAYPGIKKAYSCTAKTLRYSELDKTMDDLKSNFTKKYAEEHEKEFTESFGGNMSKLNAAASGVFAEMTHSYTREMIVNDKIRIDKRKLTDVRPIECETGLLPRSHGSALFTRGETQVMAAVTLGTADDEQFIDALEGLRKDRFMLHYNFPQFSVGETGGNKSPGRRELGHGNLARRAIEAVLPESSNYPYTIRVVSEVLESNGSSSMGTVCSATMALLDAAVPIKASVAGVAMGLIKEGDEFYILTDILGDEDHIGDMDFKVAGTDTAITAIQMDIKIDGVTKEILKKALDQAKQGRLHILGKMKEAISEPNKEVSAFAPRIEVIKIKQDYIKDVIGPQGKMVKSIVEKTGAKINIQDSGEISIASSNRQQLQAAIDMIKAIAGEPEVGAVYNATVKKIMDFGAFVEYLPGKEALVHVSEIAPERVNNVRDYLNEGDVCKVKFLGNDKQGRPRFSIKALLSE